ncbi:MAG TPA: PilZ domain-containing protein [bacterium]|nr:PilZ domain-containing protein [bacterium]
MSEKMKGYEKTYVVGLEFERLTHWDRYSLNQNLARMEREMYPEKSRPDGGAEEDLWRGERRNFYRLNTQKTDLHVSIDLTATRGVEYTDLKVINLSPAGCCILVPGDFDLHPGFRIPRLCFPFPGETLVIRAKVIHSALLTSREELESSCI